MEELRREMLELRQQLDKERSARMQMEEQVRKQEEPGLKRFFVANVLYLEVIVIEINFQPAISISVTIKMAARGVERFTSTAGKC